MALVCDTCGERLKPKVTNTLRVHIFEGTDLIIPDCLDNVFCNRKCAIAFARAELDRLEKGGKG